MMRKYIGRILLLTVSLALFWWVLRNVSWADLTLAVRSARPGMVGGAVVVVLAYYVLRAVRWQVMLRAAHRRVSLLHALVALLTGGLSSLLIPGAGEVVRLGTIQRIDGVPISEGLGSLVAERSFDVLMLLAGLLLNVLLLAGQGQSLGLTVPNLGYWLISLTVSGLAGLMLLIFGWRWFRRSGRGVDLVARVDRFWAGFVAGLLGTYRAGLLLPVVGLTVLIWLGGVLAYVLLFHALPGSARLPMLGCLTVNSLASISSIAVPTQGSIGSFHVSAAYALGLFGFSASEAAVTATFVHAVFTATNLLINGLGVLLLTFYINPILISKSESVHETANIPPAQ